MKNNYIGDKTLEDNKNEISHLELVKLLTQKCNPVIEAFRLFT